MWNRADLKYGAKDVLRRNFGMAFAAFMILILVAFIPIIVNGIVNPMSLDIYSNPEMVTSQMQEQMFKSNLISIVFQIFVFSALAIGYLRFFILLREEESISFTTLFFGFSNIKYYLTAVKTYLLTNLFIILWSLLLVIPGIIKSFQYFFVLYIIADNPEIGTKRAFQLSKVMTDGHKFNIFVLGLSFIGWSLLSMLLCFIPYIYVIPYMNATYAELYHSRKEDIIASGFATEEEFAL